MAQKRRKAKKAPKPSLFQWRGEDRKGNKLKGEMEALHKSIVISQLQKQGIKVKRVDKALNISFGDGIKPMDIAIFTRQLATMMKSGVPLIQSFDIVAEGLENKAMAKLVRDIRNDVAGGGSLAGSLSKHPKYFDELYCNLVESGEQAGALETLLDRVATYKEKSEALKSKIKKAMNYPIAVVAVAMIVTGLLMVKVVPQFADIFEGFGAELPAFTQVVVAMSDWFQANWFIAIVIIAITITLHKEANTRSKKYREPITGSTG